jgi:hypothetical protein
VVTQVVAHGRHLEAGTKTVVVVGAAVTADLRAL